MVYEKNISLLREKKFFTLFENLAGKAVEAAELLVDLKEDHSKLPQISQELNTLEEEADSVVHQILEDTMDQCEDVANILDTFRVKKLFFYHERCF